MTNLKEGDKAPSFRNMDENENEINLEAFRGKKVVLFFYPKDNTPTCTKEVCNLRDNYSLLQSKGIKVIGISADSARKHKNFIRKYSLPFPLIPDTNKKIINDYGVWGPKKMFGLEFEGIYRTTFVIDEKGHIEKIFTKLNLTGMQNKSLKL